MYKDEEIAEERYWARRKKFVGIETGIYSGKDFIEFCEKRLFEDKVGVVLPISFEEMTIEEAKKKYPSEQRPQIIMTNLDATINFAFNLVKLNMETDKMEGAVQDFALVMKRLYPTNICLNIEAVQGIQLPYAFIEFTSMAVNANLYNMVMIMPIGDELLMLLFNCPFDQRGEWTHCLTQIREGIVDYSKEETNAAN